jgi:hypothetical protein
MSCIFAMQGVSHKFFSFIVGASNGAGNCGIARSYFASAWSAFQIGGTLRGSEIEEGTVRSHDFRWNIDHHGSTISSISGLRSKSHLQSQ